MKNSSTVVNAKTVNNKIRRDSYETLGTVNFQKKDQSFGKVEEVVVDSFEQINFSNDMNFQDINL